MSWWARLFGRGRGSGAAAGVAAPPAPAAAAAAAAEDHIADVGKMVPVAAVGDDPALPLASEMIRYFEGCERVLPDGRIAPYLDVVGVATIGWGNTAWEDDRRVAMTDAPISRARAQALFAHHLAGFMRSVRVEIPDARPHEAAAFCSFAYNVGLGGFRTSSALRVFREGDLAGAEAKLDLWNKGGGRVLKGLQRRRRAEALVLRGMAFGAARRLAEAAYP